MSPAARRIAITATLAVAVLVGVSIAAWVNLRQPPVAGASPSEQSSREPRSSHTPSTVPSASQPAPGSGAPFASRPPLAPAWQEPIAIGPTGTASALIVTDDGGLLAVGGNGSNGAVWRSRDGITWSAVTAVPEIGENDAKGLVGIIRTGDSPDDTRYVAWALHGPRFSEPYETVIWTSVDGSEWRETAVLNGFVSSMLHGVRDLIAVGSIAGLDSFGGARAWTSVDGLVWVASAPIADSDQAGMLDLVAVPDGFLAVGGARDETIGSYFGQGVTWRSTDGATWTRQPDDPALDHAGLFAVSAWEGGLVAGGAVDNNLGLGGEGQRPVLWRSLDGTHWAKTYDPGCCGEVHQIAASNEYGLFALYRWYAPGGPDADVLLRYRDDQTWDVLGSSPAGTDVRWVDLVSLEGLPLQLRGLAVRQLSIDVNQPLLLVPPPDL